MMRDGILSFEHGDVRLGNDPVPGILRSQSITGLVRFDEAQQDGLSGKNKTPLGWEDANINLELELMSDDKSDCYQKLTELNAVFQGRDNGGNPKVYEVVNAHARARGIDQVVFAGLDSSETDEDDVITASLNFVEHNPPVTIPEKRIAMSDQAEGAATPQVTEEPVDDRNIMQDPGPPTAS